MLKKEIWFHDDIENGLSAVLATMQAVTYEIGNRQKSKHAVRDFLFCRSAWLPL